MTFPSAFSIVNLRVYETDGYVSDCKGNNSIPTKEGFLKYISHELHEDFPKLDLSEDDLDPLD